MHGWEMKQCDSCTQIRYVPKATDKCPDCPGYYPVAPKSAGVFKHEILENVCEKLGEIAYHLENISRKL